MLNNFEFCTPTKFYFGKGTHHNVGENLKEFGATKVLFLYGGGSIFKTGLHAEVVASLNKAGIDFVELGGVQANPTVVFCRKVVELVKAEGVDFILAVGGGSVVDTAKSAAASVGSNEDCWDLIAGGKKITAALPIGVITTISAAGSEGSEHAVLTNEEAVRKSGMKSFLIRPKFCVMNPELCYTLPPYQTACGIVDIIMHTAERYLCLTGEDELVDRLSEALIKSVISAGKRAMADPCDYEARADLMWAGMLSHNSLMEAGRSFFMSAHRLEHELSTLDDKVAHGAGLAVTWPAFNKYIYKYNPSRFLQLAVRVWNCEMDYKNPEKTILEGIEKTEEFFRSLGMPTRLGDLGFSEKDIPTLAENCSQKGTIHLSSYIELHQKEMEEIYRLCL